MRRCSLCVLAVAVFAALLLRSSFGEEGQRALSAKPKVPEGGVAAAPGGGAVQPTSIEGARNNWLIAVGVNRFQDSSVSPLKYCVADAQSIYQAFAGPGKLVPAEQAYLLTTDSADPSLAPTRVNILRKIGYATEQAVPDSTIILDLSGHGFVDDQGRSYLLPEDGRVDQLVDTAVPIARVNELLTTCKAARKILFVDACRNSPRKGTRGASETTDAKAFNEALKAAQGEVTMASCDAGQVSNEWDEMGHGVFTHYLLEGLRGKAGVDANGYVTLSRLVEYVGQEVPAWSKRNTRPVQQPWMWGSMSAAIPLSIPGLLGGETPPRPVVPEGPVVPGLAVAQPPVAPAGGPLTPPPVAPPAPAGPPTQVVPLGAGKTMILVKIEGDASMPGFWMGQTEVTQAQYEAIMKRVPSMTKGPDLPVDCVSWNDAAKFCDELSKKTGQTFDLPTEEQWEYACRFGSGRDVKEIAWYSEGPGSKMQPVRKKAPNDAGLYDMQGSVWEWCGSRFAGGEGPKVMRGGSYMSPAALAQPTSKQEVPADRAQPTFGFRVIRAE